MNGIVIKSTGSWNTVKTEKGIFECKIKGKFRIKGIKTTNPIAVGDHVEIQEEDETTGVIRKLMPRKNYIIRRSINLSKQAHILAANIDRAFLVVTLRNPVTLPAFIDRFLVSAEAYRIPVTLVFNKIDIYDEANNSEMQRLSELYTDIGYECMSISVTENINIDKIRDKFKGKTNVLSGNSGVGKSSILNALEPGLALKVGQISDTHLAGKHTTTFPEMVELSSGGYIIDTPGVRAFGLIDIEREELYHFFPEIFKISENCKFHNCLHTHEPGCAVKTAVEEGEIDETRYKNYFNMLNDEGDEKYRVDIYG